VIGGVDQYRKLIRAQSAVVNDADIDPVGAALGSVRIHCYGDFVSVPRQFHEVVDIAAGIKTLIEQGLEVDLVSLCRIVIDDLIQVFRAGFAEDKHIRARAAGQCVVAGIDDKCVAAVGEERPLELHPELYSCFSH